MLWNHWNAFGLIAIVLMLGCKDRSARPAVPAAVVAIADAPRMDAARAAADAADVPAGPSLAEVVSKVTIDSGCFAISQNRQRIACITGRADQLHCDSNAYRPRFTIQLFGQIGTLRSTWNFFNVETGGDYDPTGSAAGAPTTAGSALAAGAPTAAGSALAAGAPTAGDSLPEDDMAFEHTEATDRASVAAALRTLTERHYEAWTPPYVDLAPAALVDIGGWQFRRRQLALTKVDRETCAPGECLDVVTEAIDVQCNGNWKSVELWPEFVAGSADYVPTVDPRFRLALVNQQMVVVTAAAAFGGECWSGVINFSKVVDVAALCPTKKQR